MRRKKSGHLSTYDVRIQAAKIAAERGATRRADLVKIIQAEYGCSQSLANEAIQYIDPAFVLPNTRPQKTLLMQYSDDQLVVELNRRGYALERATEVEQLARELAKMIKRRGIKWEVTTGYVCTECGASSKTNSMDAEGDLGSLVHTAICIIDRARKMGLLE